MERAPRTGIFSIPVVITTTFLLAAPAGQAAPAENTEIPRDTVSVRFSDTDLNLFRVALFDMLEYGADGMARYWENADTGNRGRIKLVKTLEPKEPRCRVIRITSHAKKPGLKASNVFTFCRQPDGTWFTSVAETAEQPPPAVR